MRASPAQLIAALPIALGVAVGPASAPSAVSTPVAVESALVAKEHRGRLNYSDTGSPKAFILLNGQRVLLSSGFTGIFPTSEDTATVRDYFDDYLGLDNDAIICVYGRLRQIGPLVLIEVEAICT